MKVDWKSSEARKIVLNDLGSGFIPLNSKSMPARDAWDYIYGDMEEFEGVEFSQFSRNLSSYRKKMTNDPKFVWKNTCVQEIILNDMETGRLPVYEEFMSAEEAWHSMYSTRKEFKNLPFWHFEENLQELRFKKQEPVRDEDEEIHNMLREMHLSVRRMKQKGMKPSPGSFLAETLAEFPGLEDYDGDLDHLVECL